MRAHVKVKENSVISFHYIVFIQKSVIAILAFVKFAISFLMNLVDEVWHIIMISRVVRYKEPGVYEEIQKNKFMY